jgi:4-diphosphocytidyl-2-C-methyl-D-erythritol kinase
VNLTLEVLGKRPDGYHEVATVLQTVGLWDELELELATGITFKCNVSALNGEDNLVVRAAKVLAAAVPAWRGASLLLSKAIPVAAGLGGGSADAAAALCGLNALWELGLPMERLAELAAQLGSDVPFFLAGGTALGKGRGDIITSLPPVAPQWIVVVRPPLAMERKTARLYGALANADYADGSATAAMCDRLRRNALLDDGCMVNTFERVAYRVFPELDRYGRLLQDAGATQVHLAGSGPALFALAQDQAAGKGMARQLNAGSIEAWCVPTVNTGITMSTR